MVEGKITRKKEVFKDFEECEKFFKQHTILRRNDECIDPKKANKGIHGLPIKCLKSSNEASYTFPELIRLYIQKTDAYFAECGSLNSEEKVEEFRKSKFYKGFSSPMSKVKVTAANQHLANSL